MRTALVKLLHKKNGRRDIGNYRPLSLLCVDYKILAKETTERIKPVLTQVIGNDQQGFIMGGDITGNLILVKEIIEYCKEENVDAYMILMDFQKAYDRVDRDAMEQTMREMNFPSTIMELINLLYTDAEAIVIVNNKFGTKFKTNGGVRQGCPLSPYLFILVLELMAIEMRDDESIQGIKLAAETIHPTTTHIAKFISSFSHKEQQIENTDDRLSMFADDSATLVTAINQILPARINIGIYEGGSGAALNESKTILVKLGPARLKPLSKTDTHVNFKIMAEMANERYLGDIIGNNITEEDTFGPIIAAIEHLGTRWLKEHIGIYGRTIVANTLLQAKLTHRASVNTLSPSLQTKLRKVFKTFMWGGPAKKPRLRWDILLQPEQDGGTGLKDPIINLEAAKISILKRLITRDRQPWMKWVERKLIRVATRWGVPEAMAATPTKKQVKELNNGCLVESTLALWHRIGGIKRPDRLIQIIVPEETTTTKWESGFGLIYKKQWHSLETLQTKTIYGILIGKFTNLRKYTPKLAHKHIHTIKSYLSTEERNYWWKLTHQIVSIKKTESKYKRNKHNNLVSAECPLCKHPEETRPHYEYDCPTLSLFRYQVAAIIGKHEFTRAEWMLETPQPQPLETTILIAKARWAFHCARCSVDHNGSHKINLEVVLNRTQRRVQTALEINQRDLATPPT